MPYDDPTLKEFARYIAAKEPGRRERADAWATAIGLQKVDGLSPSRLLKDEREFDYGGKSPDRIIPHFACFVAQIWQVHPFAEGNSRTTAVFAIKYLRSLGYHVTNNMFKENKT